MDDFRYVKQAVVSLFARSSTEGVSVPGSLLMDAPKCDSFSELECLAGVHGDGRAPKGGGKIKKSTR